jgi:aldehyde:ferredoxin oxidoreductase
MNGFYNRVLIIDLYTRTFEKETIPDLAYETCLGGKGLATRLLMEKNPPGVDPLSGDNHLIFATGPCCQGRVWGSSRYGVFTRSPLTRFYAESYAGGRVSDAIDAAGFDAVIIKGKARRPAVATVHPEGALFYDADDLWGMDTYQAEEEVKRRFAAPGKDYRRSGAVVIGPAGENLVRFALIENDRWRSAGRTGTGAVMGSKRLKAVLFQGDRRREVHEPERLAEHYRTFARVNKEHPGVLLYKKLGTTMMVALLNKARAFPTRYWAKGHLDQWEKISGETFHQEHDVKSHSCAKCFMACGRESFRLHHRGASPGQGGLQDRLRGR